MAKRSIPISRMSNAALNRTFAHLLGHLAVEYGDHGVLKVPMSSVREAIKVGFEIDEAEDVLLMVVDTDSVKSASQ